MVRVFVWNFRSIKGPWGHASMDVNGTYTSWWPIGENRRQSKISEDIYTVHPIRGRTFDQVKKAEGNRIEKQPDHVIPLSGLNESRILQWWGKTALIYNKIEFQRPIELPWDTFGWNCSKIVAKGLKEGGGDDYSDFIRSVNLIWTPNDVECYAKKIAQNIKLNLN